MRVGILRTGRLPVEMEAVVGSYQTIIGTALGADHEYVEFGVADGELPDSAAADAYVITGSASSAYDPDPWIAAFVDWLRALDPATPLVGFCFGHQVMAHAFGGVVQRAAEGLLVGLHEYEVTGRQDWMDEPNRFALPVSHYDQVVLPPASAQVIAASNQCRYAALRYRDRRALSFQAHPEFSIKLAAMIVERWHARGFIDRADADLAQASLSRPDDCTRVRGWIRRFLEQSGPSEVPESSDGAADARDPHSVEERTW